MDKTCTCGDPPGGEITCNVDQLALCGVIDGKLVVGCFDQPRAILRMAGGASKSMALANWTLSRILGRQRSDGQTISVEELTLLQRGWYVNADTGEEVHFSLPEDLDLASVAESLPLVEGMS